MNILITGSSKGIGRAIAEKFLDEGHKVFGLDIAEVSINHPAYTHFVTDILDGPLPDMESGENNGRDPDLSAYDIDMADNKPCNNKNIPPADKEPDEEHTDVQRFAVPVIDILINNAGVQESGRDIDINLKGTIRITEKYGIHPNIKSVLFIASSSASTGSEFPEYAASKGGVVAYMKNTALRIAKYGATSNSLSPGGVVTDLNDHIIKDPALWQAVLNETMLGKWAGADEIADWAYFLTVTNRSMTAQDILVDNGEAAKFNFIW